MQYQICRKHAQYAQMKYAKYASIYKNMQITNMHIYANIQNMSNMLNICLDMNYMPKNA